MRTGIIVVLFTLVSRSLVSAAEYPAPVESDVTLREFRFASGETLPEVRIHYRTLGMPMRDAQGVVRNAVLILHGTGGEGGSLVRKGGAGDLFAAELFSAGQPLDAARNFNPPELGILECQITRVKNGRAIVIPISAETIGHGTHTKAAFWKQHLVGLLKQTER